MLLSGALENELILFQVAVFSRAESFGLLECVLQNLHRRLRQLQHFGIRSMAGHFRIDKFHPKQLILGQFQKCL